MVNPFLAVVVGRCGLGRCDGTNGGENGISNGAGMVGGCVDDLLCPFFWVRLPFLIMAGIAVCYFNP